jgi:hypothetical protein
VEVARDADTYTNVKFRINATVYYQIDHTNGADVSFMVNVGGNPSRPAHLFVPGFLTWTWKNGKTISRLLDGDKITVYGTGNGYYTYTGSDDVKYTVPSFTISNMSLN